MPIYSGISIFHTSKGNLIWLKKKSGVLKIRGKNLTEANPRDTTLGSKKREFPKIHIAQNAIVFRDMYFQCPVLDKSIFHCMFKLVE